MHMQCLLDLPLHRRSETNSIAREARGAEQTIVLAALGSLLIVGAAHSSEAFTGRHT
jgi:hypothetical protein